MVHTYNIPFFPVLPRASVGSPSSAPPWPKLRTSACGAAPPRCRRLPGDSMGYETIRYAIEILLIHIYIYTIIYIYIYVHYRCMYIWSYWGTNMMICDISINGYKWRTQWLLPVILMQYCIYTYIYIYIYVHMYAYLVQLVTVVNESEKYMNGIWMRYDLVI